MISLVAALVGIATPSDAATVTRVSPIFECYVDEGDGTYTAYFGYENRSTDVDGAPLVVTQAAGTPQNKLTPAEHEDLLPAEFGFPDVVPGRPGRTAFDAAAPNAFVVSGWDGSPLVWTLFGRTATAGLSKECAPPAADDSVAPTVELVSPAESSTVWSSITVSATASDDGGVDRVELLVDGETVASDTDAPYDLEFDTTTVDDGAHEIGVRAVDVSGNEATDAVSIVVGNALPGPARLDADFESGRIDAETYVLEATRAVFGDPDVAARYGDAPVVADPPSAWYWEVLTLVETLDPAAQQELREYLTLTVEPQDTAPSTSDLQSSGTDEPESAASALSSTSESPPAIDDRGCVAILYRIASGYVGGDCWVVVGDVDLWWDSGDFTAADFAPGDALPRNVRRYAEGFRDAQSTFEGTGPEELAYPDAGEVDVIVDGDRSTVRGVSLPNVLGLGQRILVPTNPTQPEYLAAHELFHQHQWDYAPPAIVWRPGGVREGARWWMEASAQWAAHQVQVDHGYDIEAFGRYFTTLQAFYDDASSELYRTDDFRREYGGFVVAEWLHHRAAAVSQERPADIVKRVWELVDPSTLPTAAFAQVLPGASPVFDRRQIAGMWEDLYFLYFLDVPIPGRVTQDVTDRWREGLSQSGAPFQEARGPVSWSAPIDVGETLERQFTLGGAGAAVIEVAPREVGALTVTVDAGADVETRSFPLSDYDVDPRAGAATCTYVDPEEDNRSSTSRYPVWDPGRCEGLVVIVSNATDAASSRVPVTVGVSLSAATDAVISNGTVELGVNAEGHLIVPGRRESSQKGTNALGLRYVPENNEAVSAGCYCEAWGVAATDGVRPASAWASEDYFWGTERIVVEEAEWSPTGGVSQVLADDLIRVRHEFTPATETDNLYRIDTTLENAGSVLGEVLSPRYRRVIDWDVEPTAFREFVTLQSTSITVPTELAYSSNDGFADPDPLSERTDLGVSGLFTDVGPRDHGAMVDLEFGPLSAGESLTFTQWYGAAPDETSALAAIDAVGADLYSLAQPSVAGGATTGAPNTFVWAYRSPVTASASASGLGMLGPSSEPAEPSDVRTVEEYQDDAGPAGITGSPRRQ